MGNFEVRPPLDGDAAVIACGMRPSDRLEIWAASRFTPYEALCYGQRHSTLCWTGVWKGRPIGMAGCAPGSLIGNVGYPWQLATKEIEEAALPYLRQSRSFFRTLRKSYSLLVNWVDARNAISIHWLKYMGFKIEEAAPYGVDGLPFHYFWMRGGTR